MFSKIVTQKILPDENISNFSAQYFLFYITIKIDSTFICLQKWQINYYLDKAFTRFYFLWFL